MNLLSRFDYGWLYLMCGLLLSVAAIILPAHKELEILEHKRDSIQLDVDNLLSQVLVYKSFLNEANDKESQLRHRLFNMQFNINGDGSTVVVDSSSSQTPLDWVAQRARTDRVIDIDVQDASLLSVFTEGRSRLFMFGVGAFTIFIGLISSSHSSSN